MPNPSSPASSIIGPQGCRLWIDRVGCWLLWFEDRLTIGGGAAGQFSETDFGIQAPLSRRHCQITRAGENYRLTAAGPTTVDDQRVQENIFLSRTIELHLAGDVRLRWCLPSALSRSGVLQISSAHRPVHPVEGVILVADTLLIGAGQGAHLPCAAWGQPLVLFRRGSQLFCQPQPELTVDGQSITGPTALSHGSLISWQDVCARLEVPEA